MSAVSALMRAPAQNTVIAAAGRAMPVRIPAIQRACACGGSSGVSGKCASCENEERLGRSALQPKLTISTPDDPYEQEAERVADQVMRMPGPAVQPVGISPLIQRQEAPAQDDEEELAGTLQREAAGLDTLAEDEEELQREAASGGPLRATGGLGASLRAPASGAPLPPTARGFFESRFGRGLDHVRIHSDAAAGAMARSINAHAFTHGRDIYFSAGQYDPGSAAGRRLLAHELTHVFQQDSEQTLRRKAASPASAAGATVRLPMDSPANRNEVAAERAAATVGATGFAGADAPPPAGDGSINAIGGLGAALGGQTGGAPLPMQARAFFEPRFGRDLGHVRIHDTAPAAGLARAVGARAFVHGRNIYFASGQYDSASHSGRRLLAHELTHVIQQEGSAPRDVLRRVPAPSVDQSQVGPSAAGGAESTPAAPLRELRPAPPDTVQSITISCNDMRMRIATADANRYYRMEECSLPIGSFDTTVTVTGNDFYLDFGSAVAAGESFEFAYRVEPGQTNPAELLREQAQVHVDVVEHLPAPTSAQRREPERAPAPECVFRLDDRELVPADSISSALFAPIAVPPTTIWSHPIPLGQFGWVEVEATVGADVTGTFSASYGPGRLTGICLTHLIDRTASSAPIDHPLLGPGSQADVTTYGIGGRARFTLPARMAVNLRATGRLRIAGDYLSVIELAAAEGNLSATGTATLAGSIDGAVEILARATRSRATLEDNLLPFGVVIERSSIDDVDLAAEIGLRGRAGLSFRIEAGAAFSFVGVELWRQAWDLVNFNAGVGWSGGLRYSPNPGLHLDLGSLDPDADVAAERSDDETLDDVTPHEDAAELDPEEILRELYEEPQAQVSSPDGLSERSALPFDWRKPTELYPESLDIPNAEDPTELHRDDPPTQVRYLDRGRSTYVELGVADWPSIGRTFEYFPYDARVTPEQSRFNRLLDRLGYVRSGVDAEHVWDVALRGLEWDRFDNLWPASNQDQQLAGTQHNRQIRNYEATLGNLAGRYFRIARVRHPAAP